jgi:hypothetical protein
MSAYEHLVSINGQETGAWMQRGRDAKFCVSSLTKINLNFMINSHWYFFFISTIEILWENGNKENSKLKTVGYE